jgi:hypothetical protein
MYDILNRGLYFGAGAVIFGLYYYKCCKKDKKEDTYILGTETPLNIEDEILKKIISEYLSIKHDIRDNFTIVYATKQTVAGIKYTIEIKYEDKEETYKYQFIYKMWKDEDDRYEIIEASL